RIDEAIQVRFNVYPTFYSLVGSRRSEGTTTAPLFSIIHTSLISVWTAISRVQHLTTYLHRPRTMRSSLSFWGDGGIVPFKPFFHAFLGGLEKATINRIFLILLSRKEEREIRFPFHWDQEIGSS
ncbi:hypothetical protein ES319_D02G175600v1, partial [Gossypium barbadense]